MDHHREKSRSLPNATLQTAQDEISEVVLFTCVPVLNNIVWFLFVCPTKQSSRLCLS